MILEVAVDGYNIVRNDRNRNSGGIACYIRNNICFNRKACMSDNIENIFIDLLFPKAKPISVGIIYKHPSQTQFQSLRHSTLTTKFKFLEIIINLLFRGKYVVNKPNVTKKIDEDLLPEVKRCKEFCSMYGLSQLIDRPTRITCNTSTLIDHILTNTQENISQSGVIDTAISDHSLIYCTRKILKGKYNRHKEITVRSLKNCPLMCIKRPWREFHFQIMKTLIILTLHIVVLLPRSTV